MEETNEGEKKEGSAKQRQPKADSFRPRVPTAPQQLQQPQSSVHTLGRRSGRSSKRSATNRAANAAAATTKAITAAAAAAAATAAATGPAACL